MTTAKRKLALAPAEAPETTVANCATCVFWDRHHGAAAGKCRRYPPVPLAGAGILQPTTHETQWCGEHSEGAANA